MLELSRASSKITGLVTNQNNVQVVLPELVERRIVAKRQHRADFAVGPLRLATFLTSLAI